MHPTITMNINSSSLLSFQLQQMTMDAECGSSSSLPPPPESLPSHLSRIICPVAAKEGHKHEFEFDSSKFDSSCPPSSICSTTVASSISSLSTVDTSSTMQQDITKMGWGSTLSRSRCVTNLSALGGVASETSSISRRHSSHYESSPNEAYGYFVDTPRR